MNVNSLLTNETAVIPTLVLCLTYIVVYKSCESRGLPRCLLFFSKSKILVGEKLVITRLNSRFAWFPTVP